MLTAVSLLLIPLGLRYYTSWRMARLRERMTGSADELNQLRARLDEVREQLLEARRRRRQYEVRRTFVIADMRAQSRILEELRTAAPAGRRLAA